MEKTRMKEIKVSRGEYLRILRNDLIKEFANKPKNGQRILSQRVTNAIGRLTARKLDGVPAFQSALKGWNKKPLAKLKAGNMWHNTANKIGKRLLNRLEQQKIVRPGVKFRPEHSITKKGVTGRLDLHGRFSKGRAFIVDWKPTDRNAMSHKNVRQSEKHAKLEGGPIIGHQARSWTSYLRSHAPSASKYLKYMQQRTLRSPTVARFINIAKGDKLPPAGPTNGPATTRPTKGPQGPNKASIQISRDTAARIGQIKGTSSQVTKSGAAAGSAVNTAVGRGTAAKIGAAPRSALRGVSAPGSAARSGPASGSASKASSSSSARSATSSFRVGR
jgi:hypothetical protein